jgi:hypothetical protein
MLHFAWDDFPLLLASSMLFPLGLLRPKRRGFLLGLHVLPAIRGSFRRPNQSLPAFVLIRVPPLRTARSHSRQRLFGIGQLGFD